MRILQKLARSAGWRRDWPGCRQFLRHTGGLLPEECLEFSDGWLGPASGSQRDVVRRSSLFRRRITRWANRAESRPTQGQLSFIMAFPINLPEPNPTETQGSP